MSNRYYEILDNSSMQLMRNDFQTVKSLSFLLKDNSIYSLCFFPYLALYLRSTQEQLKIPLVDSMAEQMILDIRTGLKFPAGRFNRIMKTVGFENEQADEYFKRWLRFEFLRKNNLYYNLGIYVDIQGNVIGNTQLVDYYLNSPQMDVKEREERAFQIGLVLGQLLKEIGDYFPELNPFSIYKNPLIIGYQDFNSNRKNLFVNNDDALLNLFLLHLLSIANTYYLLFEPLLDDMNTWKLRMEYVACHSVWLGLKSIYGHYSSKYIRSFLKFEELASLVETGKTLFPSDYRNAMFHYGLYTDAGPTIKETYYNESDPLFGLVESCFDGHSINQHYLVLRVYMREVREYLKEFINIDPSRTKYDLKN